MMMMIVIICITIIIVSKYAFIINDKNNFSCKKKRRIKTQKKLFKFSKKNQIMLTRSKKICQSSTGINIISAFLFFFYYFSRLSFLVPSFI